MPRYDLKRPCKHCPFRSDGTGIRFRCRERAAEIEESAYRYGFPCHLSATLLEDEEAPLGEGGYVFGEDTQHCAGYAILALTEGGGGAWPGIDNDEELADQIASKVDWEAPVFDSVEAFLDANSGREDEEPEDRDRSQNAAGGGRQEPEEGAPSAKDASQAQ